MRRGQSPSTPIVNPRVEIYQTACTDCKSVCTDFHIQFFFFFFSYHVTLDGLQSNKWFVGMAFLSGGESFEFVLSSLLKVERKCL